MSRRFHSLQYVIKPALTALLLVIFGASAPLSGMAAGTWTALTNAAPDSVSLMLLLSDGTVMCQNSGNTGWYRLTPDLHGSYVNGSWTTLAPMNYSRRYYSSQVLRNGQVFVAGGEYGTGGEYAEVYNPLANTWTVTPSAPGAPDFNFIDSISETLPNGNVLIAPVTPVTYGGTVIYNYTSNTWTTGPALYRGDDQDEAAWVKLPDTSILTIDPFGTNSERYIPSLNQWINDANVPVVMYGYGGELGAGFLLPNGNAFYIGGTNHTAIYTPTGTTSPGVWTAAATIPNNLAAVDAPAAMMANGNVLCALGPDTGYLSPTYFYEYNYVSNSFTLVGSPTGGTSNNVVPYGCSFLDLPDGTVLFSGNGSQLYDYRPSGTPVTNGIPTIISVTTNLDGSFLLTGTLFNGISEGAAYGDDEQMASDYPVARITNSSGNTLYCRTYNWSACNVMTGTNLVTTEMTLPAGLLPGAYPLVVTANGIASAPYALASSGTPLPPVTGLAFSAVASRSISFHWNPIGSTEAGYAVERSTNGVNFSIIASLGATTTNYTDSAVSQLNPCYYEVIGTNVVGLGNPAAIFTATPPIAKIPSPWASGDLGSVGGSGASGTNTTGFTVIGSGTGFNSTNDAGQSAWQPVAGDATFTARITATQNTGANTLAGVMLRSSQGSSVPDVLVGFNAASQVVQFQSRTNAGAGAVVVNGSGGLATPCWVRLARSGNTITGYSSPDGSTWTEQGIVEINLDPVVEIGLAVTSGNNNLLNTATFDNVTLTGTIATLPPPIAEWKLDEITGTNADDSVGDFDGTYNNVTLGLPGATPDTAYSAGFNGSNANITIPPINLNSNLLTITAWINPAGNQSAWSGIFFDRESSTANGLTFGTANELRYTWNNSASTYNWNSGLVPPSNQWTFVALVIQPTQAAIFMVTNGVLVGATNKVANPVQGFAGDSCIGQDTSSSSRYFQGALDEVQLFNQALTPAQFNDLAVTPSIAFITPANGQEFLPPANINLSAMASGTSGHTINLVQFFENGNLIGETTTSPFTNEATNLPAGTYAFSARMYYDSGLAVASDPVNVIVETAPLTPQNVTATAMASNLVYVTWTPSAYADGYEVSRGGSVIAVLPATGGNFYLDNNVQGGVDYCYEIIATNQVGSATGVSSCVTTPGTSGSLTWDANGSASGPQDGSATWNSSGITWWNGSTGTAWANGSLAIFGAGTSTNCSVDINSAVTPGGMIFNPSSGGTYTLVNDGDVLTFSNQTVVLAYSNAVFDVGLSGPGGLIKAGNGTLTLEVDATGLTGGIAVNAGELQITADNFDGAFTPSLVTINANGTLLSNNTHALGGGTSVLVNRGTWLMNDEDYKQNLAMVDGLIAPGGGGDGLGLRVGYAGGGGSYTWYVSNSIAGSVVNVPIDAISGTTLTWNVRRGAAAADLTINGQISSSGNLVFGGNGITVLTADNTCTGTTIVSNETLQVDGFLSTNTVTVKSASVLTGTGTLNGATTVQSGGTLAPGDAGGIGTLTFNSTLALNSGSACDLALGNFNGIVYGDQVVVAGTLTQNGSLVVTNVGNEPLAAGDSFQLFAAGTFSGNFSGKVLPALATNLIWDTSQLAANGAIFVAALPAITGQPQSVVTNAGNPVVFGVAATGNATLAYQWRLNGTNLAGSTLATLTLNDVQPANAGNYTVVVTNNYGSVTSAVAALTVDVAPAISSPPQSLTVYVNSNAMFSVTAGGNPAPAYQWYFNGTNIFGATATNYIVTAAQTTNEGSYTVGISNLSGSVTSSPASLSLFREFGCAPLPYPSLLANNGATHLIVPGFQLGLINLTNLASTDARTNTANEDGVSFTTLLQAGQNGTVQVVASAAGYLDGWIDYNTNGSWADAGEQMFTNTVLVAGTNVLTFSVPANAAVTSGTWARFRFSSATNLSFTGGAPNGEVEDYSIAILSSVPVISSVSLLANGGFSLNGTGVPGETCVLLGTTNLAPPAWLPIATNMAGTNGAFQFIDPGATNYPQRFYQIQTP